MPGTIMLTAMQTPQKTYHHTFGTISTLNICTPISTAKAASTATIKDIHEYLFRPSFPASFKSDGNSPAIRPINRQVETASYFVRKNSNIRATTTNPTATPKNTGSTIEAYFLKERFGWERNSIIGLYKPNITHNTPPEIPGSTAPRPTSAPTRTRLRNVSITFSFRKEEFILPYPYSICRGSYCSHGQAYAAAVRKAIPSRGQASVQAFGSR